MWQTISASVQGISHLRLDLPCQDRHGSIVSEKYAIIAVADGLGSATEAEAGANLAVMAALESAQRRLLITQSLETEEWSDLLTFCFTETRESLEKLAGERGCPLRDYATTLIVVILTTDCFAVGQLGDGAVVALFAREQQANESTQNEQGAQEILCTVSPPQHGEYINETLPITLPNALDMLQRYISPIVPQAVAIFSDGLQSLALNWQTNIPYEPFFTPLFDAIKLPDLDTEAISQQLAEFLRSERVCMRTDDDKTLVIVGKRGV